MPSTVQTVLKERFGFRSLRPIQKQIIDRVMGGGDALVVMPTGSGKSLCYQLPAIALPQDGVTLVFSPLIALMEDQVAALKAKKIKAEYINSTLSRRERDRRAKRLAEGKYELLYATPERMQKPEFVDCLMQVPGGVKLLAVDEAHCISRWGHDLRPAYQQVGKFRKLLGNPPTLGLTATATKGVRADVRRTLGLDERRMPLFSTPVERPNLSMEVIHVWDDDNKIDEIGQITKRRGRSPLGTGIIYFARIKDLDHLAGRLREMLDPRPTAIYHGQLPPRDKKKIYDRFITAEPAEGLVLFATNAFGMGVDKADIRFIIHAQMPGSVEAYYQEVGRAGRDGKKSRCVMLYAPDDLAVQQQFIEWSNPSGELLGRTSHELEHDPHSDFDASELQLLIAGKARTIPVGLIDHTLIALSKRGVIERTSMIGRYRFVRPIRNAELDPAAIERKKQRDLRRLLDVVKITKTKDISAFISKYFDLGEGKPSGRGGRRRRRGGRGRKKKAERPEASKKTATKKKPGPRRRRRRRRGGRKKES
ncbi:MAG: ATP-dependent DNA helicase RecQ [Planctomycetes bacterium]|nr:ATP-dependent DNA helicase RecQ [Planctomycetota bacterium]